MRPISTVAVRASIRCRASSAPSMPLLATVTVPSSSTSIEAPVASWIERIILPPGPISRPIFSGSMCVRSSRGAQAEISVRGREMAVSIFRRISMRASRACVSVAADDLLADAVDLQVQLDARDAVLRAGHLEIHVAVVVLVADDVGQQGPAVGFLDQADGDAGDRVADRHAGGHQAQRRAADLAIELEPLDSRMSEMMRIV